MSSPPGRQGDCHDSAPKIERLFIDQQVYGRPRVQALIHRLNLPPQVVDHPREVYQWVSAGEDPIQRGKHTLFVTANRGRFVRRCPGTRNYTCCGYQILHMGTFCAMDCAYCILQGYFHPPVLQLFVNDEAMHRELDRLFLKPAVSRIGTGEFTDSLLWEYWTPLARDLVSRFGTQHRAVLELKTKTVAIDGLEKLDHGGKTILAWSLNTPEVIHRDERLTASLDQRLEAASQVASWGYPLAFHFDPIVLYSGCENDYEMVIRRLFATLPADRIVWISLGSFRFSQELKPIIARRFPQSKIIYGEFVPGLDGKMRYFKPLRIEIYRRMAALIRQYAPGLCLYFCMEDDEVWQKSLGFRPQDRGGLHAMLDASAVRRCGLEIGGWER